LADDARIRAFTHAPRATGNWRKTDFPDVESRRPSASLSDIDWHNQMLEAQAQEKQEQENLEQQRLLEKHNRAMQFIAADVVEELVTEGKAVYVTRETVTYGSVPGYGGPTTHRSVDAKGYVWVVDVMGRVVKSAILEHRRDQPGYYRVLWQHESEQFPEDPTHENVQYLLEKRLTKWWAEEAVDAYIRNPSQIAAMNGFADVLQGTQNLLLNLVPGWATYHHYKNDGFWQGTLSLAGDLTLFFGPALKAAAVAGGYAKTAKGIQVTAVALEGSLAAIAAGQAGYELYREDGSGLKAAGYIGETFLRLFGVRANLKKATPALAAVSRAETHPWETIDEFRTRTPGLEQLGERIPTPGDGLGTVAYSIIEGKPVFGANSSIAAVFNREKAVVWRDWLIDRYPHVMKYFHRTQSPNIALHHAEASALIAAFEKTGGRLPKVLTLYVDRVSCAQNCRVVLPYLANEMGIEELTLIFKNNQRAIVRDLDFQFIH
jgi:hypothetical protein